MKDWRRFSEHQSIELRYYPTAEFDEDLDDDVNELRVAEAHEAIAAELAPAMKALQVAAEQPDDEGLAAGGGPEFDAIMYVVLSVMGGYVTLREVATDIRKIISHLQEKAERTDDLAIPESAALLLAWDHVAPPESHTDTVLEYIAPLNRVNPGGYTIGKGWLVGFTVDGHGVTVVMDRGGEVLGTTAGLDLALVPALKEGWESETARKDDSGD